MSTMPNQRVTRASSQAANSEGAQSVVSGGRTKKAGSAVRQSVASRTNDTYGSKGADKFVAQTTTRKTKKDIAVDFPAGTSSNQKVDALSAANLDPSRQLDLSTLNGSSSDDQPSSSDRRAARNDKYNAARNANDLAARNGNNGITPIGSLDADNATVLGGMPIGDHTLRTQDIEDNGGTSYRPSFLHAVESFCKNMVTGKKWLLLLTVFMLATAYLVSEPFYGPILGTKHGLLPVRSGLRHTLDNGMPAPVNSADDHCHQRLEDLESRVFKLTNEKPVHADKYQVDYFDPFNQAVTWPKYTSPEKMRKVGGWMGFFDKEVPFNEAPKIIGPFRDLAKMWCAPSVHGKAQVTVLLPRTIIPKKLVIDQPQTLSHSLDGLPSYPKAVELWARRAELGIPDGGAMGDDAFPAPDDQGRQLAPEHVLPDDFQLIGSWQYDIHAGVEKQSFVPQKNIVTSAVAVRVVSNWGNAAQSCIHKLQLFGEEVDLEKRARGFH